MKTFAIDKTEQAMIDLQNDILKAIQKAKKAGLTRTQVLCNAKVIIMENIRQGEAKQQLDSIFSAAIGN